jgi:hypothetical protein
MTVTRLDVLYKSTKRSMIVKCVGSDAKSVFPKDFLLFGGLLPFDGSIGVVGGWVFFCFYLLFFIFFLKYVILFVLGLFLQCFLYFGVFLKKNNVTYSIIFSKKDSKAEILESLSS